MPAQTLTHLRALEAESIHIIREVAAEFDNPVMLFSIGKDSCVMLHLARKAFAPGKPPFPLLQIDTTWNFQSMYGFRDDYIVGELGLECLVHINEDGLKQGIDPFEHGSKTFTEVMNLGALRQALDKYKFDAAFGGGRRDEEKSRAKERVYSFRDANHQWDPKNQRPELWNIYNGNVHKGEQIRSFPLSNWTELDIWQYIHLENIKLVPIYFASEMEVVEFEGNLIAVDDDRMPKALRDTARKEWVRFRTLGDYPLSGATPSRADTLPQIIQEMLLATRSEREGRAVDKDPGASMEEKKQQGYY
ncbi:MAG: sulfate adenylyltransferase subunit CysD [Planctomycetota bacterium]